MPILRVRPRPSAPWSYVSRSGALVSNPKHAFTMSAEEAQRVLTTLVSFVSTWQVQAVQPERPPAPVRQANPTDPSDLLTVDEGDR